MAPKPGRPQEYCPWCGQPLKPIFIHGAAHCAVCGVPVYPCCEGAPVGAGQQPVEYCPLPSHEAQAEGGERRRRAKRSAGRAG